MSLFGKWFRFLGKKSLREGHLDNREHPDLSPANTTGLLDLSNDHLESEQRSVTTLSSSIVILEGTDHTNVDETRLPYALLRILGSGGCSVVEEVQDLSTGHNYARKLFIMKRRNKERLREIFENELKIIRSLEHHHMVRIFATYTTKDRLALILTPVADDGDLDSYLEEFTVLQKNPEAHETRIASMTQVLKQSFGCLAAGLTFMHQTRVRHKDIKTHNILVHRDRVLYTDFGLSRDTSVFDNSMSEGPTEATRRYAAPEVLQGKSRNSSSDVYSLGCVFVEIYMTMNNTLLHDERPRFPDAMSAIQNQFASRSVPVLGATCMLYIMPGMISDNPANRPTAEQVWHECARQDGFQCANCHDFRVAKRVCSPKDVATNNPVPEELQTIQSAPVTKNSTVLPSKAETKHELYADTRPHYTPWRWSEAHKRHYSYLTSPVYGTILDTIWSGAYPEADGSKKFSAVDLAYRPGVRGSKSVEEDTDDGNYGDEGGYGIESNLSSDAATSKDEMEEIQAPHHAREQKVRLQQDQLYYDRRAERRNMESLRKEIEHQAKHNRETMLQQLDFDQAVALVRANEDKIRFSEREALERRIAELSKELADKSHANYL